MKRTPLKRTRGWPRGRSARKLAHKDKLDKVTPALLERAKYRCEICRVLPVAHRHHKLRQAQGGTNDLDNLLALCLPCHEYVHRFPRLSYEQGWLLRKSEFNVDLVAKEE